MIRSRIRRAGYTGNPEVLKDLYFDMDEGITLITGASGSGKTTFLLAITGVLKHLLRGNVSGEIALDDIDPLTPKGFRRIPGTIGFVLQDPEKQIAMPTPWDEVSFTLENLGFPGKIVERRTKEMLGRYGLLDKAYTHVEELSGGEKRRLTIAAAIAHEPSVLLFDEPSASIDPWGIKWIREEIARFASKGYTVVVVEHKIRYFADLAGRILVLDRGRIVAEYRGGLSSKDINRLLSMGIDARLEISVSKGKELGEPVLRLNAVDVGYRGKPLVKSIDLDLHRGEVMAIIGRNGCGKTTLLKTIAGALEPLAGDIELRGKAFYTPQQPDYLFLKLSLEEEVRELSKKTGIEMDELIKLIPWFGENRKRSPYRLSHGQRKWLSIVIGYSYSHDLILLDEPTTGLDYRLFVELKGLINRLSKAGTAFIIATHDPRVVGELADTVVLIDAGRAEYVDKEEAVNYLESVAGVVA
ncbi:MAG: ABC transporter [Thermoprotei archaeon]|nr:MAG: ABC transporter [Thermoprotei archaeon]